QVLGRVAAGNNLPPINRFYFLYGLVLPCDARHDTDPAGDTAIGEMQHSEARGNWLRLSNQQRQTRSGCQHYQYETNKQEKSIHRSAVTANPCSGLAW